MSVTYQYSESDESDEDVPPQPNPTVSKFSPFQLAAVSLLLAEEVEADRAAERRRIRNARKKQLLQQMRQTDRCLVDDTTVGKTMVESTTTTNTGATATTTTAIASASSAEVTATSIATKSAAEKAAAKAAKKAKLAADKAAKKAKLTKPIPPPPIPPPVPIDAKPRSTKPRKKTIEPPVAPAVIEDQPTVQKKSKPVLTTAFYRFVFNLKSVVPDDIVSASRNSAKTFERIRFAAEESGVRSDLAVVLALTEYIMADAAAAGVRSSSVVVSKVAQVPPSLLNAIDLLSLPTTVPVPVPTPVPMSLPTPVPMPETKTKTVLQSSVVESMPFIAGSRLLPIRPAKELEGDRLYEMRLQAMMNVDPIQQTTTMRIPTINEKNDVVRQSYAPFRFAVDRPKACSCRSKSSTAVDPKTCAECNLMVVCGRCARSERFQHNAPNCAMFKNLIREHIRPQLTGGPNTCLYCDVRYCADHPILTDSDCCLPHIRMPAAYTATTMLAIDRASDAHQRLVLFELVRTIGSRWTSDYAGPTYRLIIDYLRMPPSADIDRLADRVTVYTNAVMDICCQTCRTATYCSEDCREDDRVIHANECGLQLRTNDAGARKRR